MKRLLAMLLALCLIFGQVPATVFAAEPGTAPEETAEHHEEPEVTLPPVEEEAPVLGATSGTCGENVTWTLSDDGVLTISGTGSMEDYTEQNSAPWYSTRSSISSVIIQDGVTTIGNRAFVACSSLSNVMIPNSVTSIGGGAFSGCSSLSSVTIPNSVTTLGESAFSRCESLSSVTIPNSVTTIGSSAFASCYSLSSVTILNGVTTIGESAFWHCESLSSVTIPNSVTTIGSYAFASCYSLSSVTIPDGVTVINEQLFGDCNNLKSVTIPDSVRYIDNRAFCFCESLTSVEIPDSVITIGEYAFGYCESLTSVEIPDSVITIGEFAFGNCESMHSVTIGNGVTAIDDYAFGSCDSLSNLSLGSSVFRIGKYAFAGGSMRRVTIPDSVSFIDDSAFRLCSKLTEIVFLGDAPEIHYSAFVLDTATAYYPEGNATWTADKLQNYGGTITWVSGTPKEKPEITATVIPREQLLQLAIKPIYINDPMQVLKWKNVTLDDVTFDYFEGNVNSSSGLTISHEKAMKQDIVLSKEEYWDYVLPTAVAATLMNSESDKNLCYSLTAYMLKDRKDGKPYISTIFGRETGSDNPYQDFRVTALTATKGKQQDIIVTAVGLEGKNATYYLAQDEARRVESRDGVFSAQDLFSVFEDGSTVYAYAKTADGTITEPQAIKIIRNDPEAELLNFFEQSEFSLFGSDFLKFTAPDSIPLLGGMEFSLSAIEIPLGFDIQNDVVKISIGMDVFKRQSTSTTVETQDVFHDFKDLVFSSTSGISSGKDKIDDYKRTAEKVKSYCEKYDLPNKGWMGKGAKSNSFTINVLGYVEGKIVDNKIVVKECALSIGGTMTFKYTAQGAVWIVPVYGSVEAGGSITATSKDFKIIPASDIPFEHDIILDIAPKVTGRAGVGVKGAASAGLYATGSLPIKVEFKRNHFTMSLKGEVGVEAELFILKGDKVILEGDTMLVEKYWDSKSMSVNAVTVLDDGCPDNSTTVTTVISRDYADSTSDWLGDWYFATTVDSAGSAVAAKGVSFRDLQTSIFANSQPQLVTVGDEMLLTWVEDDLNRDAYNRMRLVYSVYDPVMEIWSAPQPVWDDGHNDGYPILTSDGENAYVLWQKVNTTLNEENTTGIDAALENSELCLAKFENGAFVDAQMLTSDSLYEYAHNVVILGGEPVIYWASSTENAMNVSGNNALYRWENGATEEIAKNLNYILSIDAIDGEVTYVMDADGELDTPSDVTAFAISDAGTTSFDNSEMAAITWAGYAPLDGENVLFLSDMGNIYYEQNGELKTVLTEVRTMGGNLNIVETDLGTAILWTEQVEGWNELYAVTYEGGIWSEPVQISENGELLTKVAATCYDGKLTGICNANSITYDESTDTYTKGETDLALFTVNDFSDIELGSYLTINEAELEIGQETELYVTVYNNGTLPVDEVTFTVSDTLGTESEQTVYIDIPSGGSELVTLTYLVPEGYTSTTLTVAAAIDDADANPEDNTVSLEIGNHDLSVTETAVEMLEGGYLLKATVENGSLVDAENVSLSVHIDDEDSEALQTVTVGTIARENYALAEILLVEDALTFDENGASKVYLKLDSSGTESSGVDNSVCIIVTQAAETICMHPVTETVERLEPTCTKSGHDAYEICAACGATVGEIVEIPALEHQADAEGTTIAPTCTEQGYTTYICSVCGVSYVGDYVDATGHSYETVVTSPTCTEQGYTTYTCTACGDSYVDDYTDPAGHSYEAGICTECGEEDPDYVPENPSGTCGENLSWIIEDGVLTISGTGEMWNYSDINEIPWMTYYEQITSVVIGEGVTSIGDCAFSFLPITSVTIPETVTHIGVASFAYTTNLTSVELPDSLISIGEEAFGISGLTEVTIPANLSSLGAKAFVCPNMTAIHVDEANPNCYSWNGLLYCDNVLIQVPGGYAGELELHTYTGYINDYALLGCTKLEKLTICANILEFGPNAFYDCTSLKEIRFLGDAPDTIPGNVFDGITATVSYPDANTTWTDEVKQSFGGNLTWTTFGENLVAQGYCGETRYGSESAQNIHRFLQMIPDKNIIWKLTSDGTLTCSGEGVMADNILVFGGMHAMGGASDRVTRVVLGEGITHTGVFEFIVFSELKELILPSTLEMLGMASIMSLSKLETITLPQNLKHIGALAFGSCTGLTSIEIPASVEIIEAQAFQDCTALTEIRFPGNAPTIAEDSFTGVTATAYYPEGDATWTSDVMQQYGGTITWEPYCNEDDVVASGTCGENLTWKLDSDGVLTISGTGPMADYYDETEDIFSGIPWESHKKAISRIVIEDGVTRIGNAAFYELDSVTDVVIPASVTEIGFASFCACLNLTAMTIPEGVTTIGANAFLNCMSLMTVTIPGSVTEIGDYAFSGTPSLQGFQVDPANPCFANDEAGVLFSKDGKRLIKAPGMIETYAIPEGVTVIGSMSFNTCFRLTELVVPASVETIENNAFEYCNGQPTIRFHGNAPTFERDVFWQTTATAYYPANDATWTSDVMQQYGGTITWEPYGNEDEGDIVASGTCGENLIWKLDSNGVLTISGNGDMYDFEWCAAPWYEFSGKMTDLRILEGVTSIGYNAFNNCRMNSVSLPDSLIRIAEDAFAYCFELTEVTIPENVEQIGAHPFRYCQKLAVIHVDPDNRCFITDESGVVFDPAFKTVVMAPNTISGHYAIPEGVETIGNGAFYTCSNLTGVAIPDSVKTIGEFAFASSDLSEVTIPEGVTHIFYCAFNFCSDLTEVTFLGDAPYFSDGVFSYVTATAWYPAGNPTWTAYVMQNCAETITWKPYVDGTVITSGWSGATTWKLYDNGTLMVFGNGNMKNYDYAGGQPWLDKGVDITNVIVTEGVTGIGSGAFRNLTTLKSVTLPATTLTKMGEAAFYGSGLESVEIPASLWTIQPYTFKNCTSLKSVKFNEGNLQKISDGAFYGTGLTEVVLPDCLDILDTFAFKGCADLTSITIGSGLTELREAVFYGTAIPTITIPEGITKIGPYAFKLCTKLETIHLPESLTSVGEASFYDCAALTAIELPDAVTDIGNYAFRRCTGLTSVTFGERLTTIGESSFYGCTGIPELTIPDSVTTIKGYAFKGCTGLTAVTLGSSVETLGESAFHTCTGLKTLVFPASVRTIGAYCFSGSYNLWKLTFEGDAPSIGTSAFKGLGAYAYYPGGNTTWTADVMQNYGGSITWKAN